MSTIRWLCVCRLQAVLYSYFFCIVFVFHYRNKQRQRASKRWQRTNFDSTFIVELNFYIVSLLCFPFCFICSFFVCLCFAFKASPASVMTVSATCKGCHRLTKLINRSLVPCSFSWLDLNQLFASHFAIGLICLHLINQQSSVALQWSWQCPRRSGRNNNNNSGVELEHCETDSSLTSFSNYENSACFGPLCNQPWNYFAASNSPYFTPPSLSLSVLCSLWTNCNGK